MAYNSKVEKRPPSKEMLLEAHKRYVDLITKTSAAGITKADLERDVKEVFEEIKASRRSGYN
ncbi:hypothetical protein GTO91_05570 [Heliobacterium undosum]|uniref:Uncharacterized protein n=1 Tax=Heliomicrobium undosum TaxID=121734 RepID=A0A845L2E6_9FIRM|nr:hypothetical protein [Heliomicrobium undosum]MZP29175.1 hypothetical protein [Heliomicrobium undosum]